MEALLNKISDRGLDAAAANGPDAIEFWTYVRTHIAVSSEEQAQCFIISAEHLSKQLCYSDSIADLNAALSLLKLPQHSELILEIKNSLSDRFYTIGDYSKALTHYVESTNIAVEHGNIDAYATAIIGLGNLCDAYGDHSRALSYYQKIDSIDHALTSRSLRLKYKLYMLACYIHLGRKNKAASQLKECEQLSILVSDKVLSGQVYLYHAMLLRHKGQAAQALEYLANVQYTYGNLHSTWLSNMMRLELAYCLNELGRSHLSNWLLESTERRVDSGYSPMLSLQLFNSLSTLYEQQSRFQLALAYQKKAYDVESELVRTIPIGELGASQLRRLSRFDLQLKLILSEIENRELKETTENQKHTVEQLQQDAFTDPMTALRNRRWMEVKLKDLLLHETPFSLLIIDIDHFKSINDELSHLVGDNAITHVSQLLAEQFNAPGASCVRFGGEEFLVILENTDENQAKAQAEQYRHKIFQFNWRDILGERGLTVSVGVTKHRDGENTQRTFYRADKALYRAKANGRNQVCIEN